MEHLLRELSSAFCYVFAFALMVPLSLVQLLAGFLSAAGAVLLVPVLISFFRDKQRDWSDLAYLWCIPGGAILAGCIWLMGRGYAAACVPIMRL